MSNSQDLYHGGRETSQGDESGMTANSNSYPSQLDAPIPDSFSAGLLSIALIGPDDQLRKAAARALAECHEGEIREFSSYPPSLDDVPRLLEQQHDVVMIELDSNPEYALDLVEGICAKGIATVMIYSEEADPDLSDPELMVRCMRAGAREFLSFPFGNNALAEALIRAAARRSVVRIAKKTGGRILVFCGAKGGSGVTTIACSFAAAVARESLQRTLLIDLVLMGDAALNLGLVSQYSTLDALQNFNRLDSSFLSKLLVKHESGISVLAAPGKVVPFQISNEALHKLLTIARNDFDNVVIDMGSKLELINTALFEHATTVYLVTQSGISELRNSSRLIAQYAVTIDSKLEIVLNRYQSRGMLVSEQQIAKVLTKPAKWRVPNDSAGVQRMQSNAVSVEQADSSFSAVTEQMARFACGLPDAPAKKKRFSLKNFGRSISAKISSAEEPLRITQSDPTPIFDGGDLLLERAEANARTRMTDGNNISDAEAEGKEADDILPNTIERERRKYKGVTYVKQADGQWYQETAVAQAEQGIPSIDWPAPASISYGTALTARQFNATASVQGIFTYTPAEGYVLPAGTHTLWVTFTPKNSEDKNTVQSSVPLVVSKAKPTITWPPSPAISYGTALSISQLNATASIPGILSYTPAEGKILLEGTHTLSVVFTPDDLANYTSATADVTLAVTKPTPDIAWPTPSAICYGTALSSAQLNATASVSGTFVYTPAEGEMLTAGPHTLVVIFNPANANDYTAAQAKTSLFVSKAIPAISWRKPVPMTYGTSLGVDELNARASTPGEFSYTSAGGNILPAGTHTLSVIFTPTDTENYTITRADVLIEVVKAAPTLTWSDPVVISYGTALSARQLNATASIPGTFSYIPVVGAVLGAGKHTPSVIFTPQDSINYTSGQATVSLTVSKAEPVITWPTPAPISYGMALAANQLNATATVSGTFVYSPAEGTVLTEGIEVLSATFTPTDVTNYNVVQAKVSLTVSKATPVTIDWPRPSDITYGAELSGAQLNASASIPGIFVYAPANGDVLAAGKHTLSVTFTPADTNIPAARASVSLVVSKMTPAIQWQTPASITYGDSIGALQLNAVASVPGSFSYTPALGTTLTAGRHKLAVVFNPSDIENYTTAHADAHLIVKKARPIVAWRTPVDISYGVGLSSAQLNAVASVPGTFVYAPSAGTVLAAGSQTLSVNFTPVDSGNFTAAQATVSLRVDQLANVTLLTRVTHAADDEAPSRGLHTNLAIMGAPRRRIGGEIEEESSLRTETQTARTQTPLREMDIADFTEIAGTMRGRAETTSPKPNQHQVAETRTYKGCIYEKGSDGQWHLQKS